MVMVRFDQPMDQASVEQAFAIEPAVPGEFSWPQPDTLAFTPADPLARSTGYSIRVADSASALSGETLQQPVEIDWQTVGNFSVSQFQPEDGARSVQTDAVVTVVFNQPVVPLVATGDQADLPQPLIFEPAVAGAGEWTSTSIYRFQADPAFAGGTSYTVSVDPTLENFAGGVIEDAPTWQFTTLDCRKWSLSSRAMKAVAIAPSHGRSRSLSACPWTARPPRRPCHWTPPRARPSIVGRRGSHSLSGTGRICWHWRPSTPCP